jgi:hypothetical protein
VEQHSAGLRLLDRVEHLVEALREALDERAVVQRRPELRAVHPVDPELGVLLQTIEREMDRLDAVRRRAALVVVPQVDDRAHAILAKRVPARGAEPVHRLGADQRARPGHPPVDRRQPAEVACVDAAVPV